MNQILMNPYAVDEIKRHHEDFVKELQMDRLVREISRINKPNNSKAFNVITLFRKKHENLAILENRPRERYEWET